MSGRTRIEWVDTVKGISIVLVVMVHAVLGVEIAVGEVGWMHPFVEFAAPFRMPAFFMVSGLFLARTINSDWRTFLDRKLVHFAYFYVLWLTIQFAVKAPFFAAEAGAPAVVLQYLDSFINPFGTLWFIYMLPVFFVAAKLAHDRGIPKLLMLGFAALLQIAPVNTGWLPVDEFASRFVYFYAGYAFAPKIFDLADRAARNVPLTLTGLAIWLAVNIGLVARGWDVLPVVSLMIGALGAMAMVAVSVLIAKAPVPQVLRYFGTNSIVIYLAFFFPMAASRIILLKTGWFEVGFTSFLVTVMAVLCPLVLHWMIERTGVGGFLFHRPNWAHLHPKPTPSRLAQPAE